MTFRDLDVSNNTSSHLAPVFTSDLWSIHGLSHMSLLTCFPKSLLNCTPYCLTSCCKISLLNAASSGMKHISARCGSFLTTTTHYRTDRADDWRSDNRLLPSILVFFFLFFLRFWFITRFSFDSYSDVTTFINLKDRASHLPLDLFGSDCPSKSIWEDSG